MKKLIKEEYGSSNLFDKLSLLTENQVSEIIKGLEWTTKNIPDAVLVGGTALVHYLSNSRDLTPDIDFLIPDMQRLKSKLDNENFLYRPLIGVNGNMGITVNDFNTDYLDVNSSGNAVINKLILKTNKIAKIAGHNVKIVIPELLAIMKIELGRDKDTKDGLSLITSGILNKEVYLKLVNGLKNYLSDYSFLLSYGEML